jgi:hypothetical protein
MSRLRALRASQIARHAANLTNIAVGLAALLIILDTTFDTGRTHDYSGFMPTVVAGASLVALVIVSGCVVGLIVVLLGLAAHGAAVGIRSGAAFVRRFLRSGRIERSATATKTATKPAPKR